MTPKQRTLTDLASLAVTAATAVPNVAMVGTVLAAGAAGYDQAKDKIGPVLEYAGLKDKPAEGNNKDRAGFAHRHFTAKRKKRRASAKKHRRLGSKVRQVRHGKGIGKTTGRVTPEERPTSWKAFYADTMGVSAKPRSADRQEATREEARKLGLTPEQIKGLTPEQLNILREKHSAPTTNCAPKAPQGARGNSNFFSRIKAEAAKMVGFPEKPKGVAVLEQKASAKSAQITKERGRGSPTLANGPFGTCGM
ncbi:MAG: hypothetical protein P4M13_01910 [Alphaproteobacteria bacterium]|nr:hypothetical protein [Alphaproteobacteria bacterium]